jgi:hypothetical protein
MFDEVIALTLWIVGAHDERSVGAPTSDLIDSGIVLEGDLIALSLTLKRSGLSRVVRRGWVLSLDCQRRERVRV